MSAELTPLESAVLEKLLEKRGDLFDAIREQLAHASVKRREFTGAGFFTYFSIPPDARVRRDLRSTELDDVGAKIPGLEKGAGFLLFIRDGVISFLEGFTYGDADWPDLVTEFSVCDVNDLTNR